MNFKLAISALIPALALAAGSAHAAPTIVHLDGPFISTKFFYTVDAQPDGSFQADYGATPKTSTTSGGAFDYLFEYTVPVAGIVNGSFSATLPASSKITGVSFDGKKYAYTAGSSSLNVTPFTVAADSANTIEVTGNLGTAKSLTFDGTLSFDSAVPEPATWTTFLLGFGFIGLGLRRKLQGQFQAA